MNLAQAWQRWLPSSGDGQGPSPDDHPARWLARSRQPNVRRELPYGLPRRRITHTDWEADRARETAIPAMVITTAAVAGTAAVNFLSAIRR
jgi:hypothetical protein